MDSAANQKTFTPLSDTEIAAFCSQMAMVLQSGISTLEGISLMLEEAGEKSEEGQILQIIYDRLLETGIFYQALCAPAVFPEYMLQMCQIGEETGKLDEVMTALAAHYEREADIAQSIHNAILYPSIMIIMMLAVILVLITRVMPIFAQVFAQLGSEMTGLSAGILAFGQAINQNVYILIGLLILIIALIFYFGKTDSGRKRLSTFINSFSLTRGYAEKLAACRFASGMALTLSSGMSTEEAMALSEKLCENEAYKKKLEACHQEMLEGSDLSLAMNHQQIFSGIYARMASLANRTGSLDEVMKNIADHYQQEIDQRLSSIIAAIEPTLVIALSVIVGLILMSVMLPLTTIMSNL